MNKIYLYIFALFLMIIICLYFIFTPKTSPNTVEILQDNTVIQTINLDEVTSTKFIKINYGEHNNLIKIEPQQISIVEADCPDKICMQMGILKHNLPIICLPNHLTIRYVDTHSTPASTLDSATN